MLMVLRLLLGSVFMGLLVLLQIRRGHSFSGPILEARYALAASIYALSLVYLVMLKRARDPVRFTFFQLLVDTLLVTALLYVTGGGESLFSFLYILVILAACMLLPRRRAFIIASASSIFYGILTDLHYYGLVHPLGAPEGAIAPRTSPDLFFMVLANIAGFFLVAYLGTHLAQRLRVSLLELKEREEDLAELQLLKDGIVSGIQTSLVVLDSQKRVLLLNPAAEATFALKSREAIHCPVEEVLPCLRGKPWERLSPVGQAEVSSPSYLDLELARPGSPPLPLRLTVSPLRLLREKDPGWILSFQDMTRVREVEEQMKRMESLALMGEMAAGMAHEIRNPMASISGSVQMLRTEMEARGSHARLMEIISREITRLEKLVEEFLQFARPPKTVYTEVDLNDLIHRSLKLLENMPGEMPAVEVRLRLEAGMVLRSDPAQIQQALWNLLANALEAMPEGGLLEITTRWGPVTGPRKPAPAAILVRDTGKGMDPATRARMFTPFFTTKPGGSGLGLAIVRRIAEALGGEVSGETHPEGGCVFLLLLPGEPGRRVTREELWQIRTALGLPEGPLEMGDEPDRLQGSPAYEGRTAP